MTVIYFQRALLVAIGTALLSCAIDFPKGATGPTVASLTTTQSSLTIGVNQQKDLLPLIRLLPSGAVPTGPLTWEVSNPALLSVDAATGRATGWAEGSVVVWVKTADKASNTTQLLIDVVGEGAVVKEVVVRPKTHYLAVGDSITLQADVRLVDGQLNANVLWSSSDDTLAVINRTNGRATALKPGKVTIIAAYAPDATSKGLAELIIYGQRDEIPPSPLPTPFVSESLAPTANLWPTAVPILPSPGPVVKTFAGPASGLYHGTQDGKGTEARFFSPYGLALTPDNRLLVTDQRNHRIRAVTLDGVVSTVAGEDIGFANGKGARARFNYPRGLAVDRDGNAFIADSANHRIRKLSPDGAVTTYAGSEAGFADGPVASATFSWPDGLLLRPDGTLYVADAGNHRIRKISPDGMVTTLAGSEQGFRDGPGPQARFSKPSGLAMAPDGALLVADVSLHRIRKVAPDGTVSTLAFQGDGPGSPNELSFPRGLLAGPDGTLFVAESGGVRKISPDGRFTPPGQGGFWMRENTGMNGFGMVFGPDGRMFIADDHSNSILVIEPG